MNHIDTFKNKTNETNASNKIEEFFKNIKNLTVTANINDEILIEGLEYFYINGEHIAIVSHMSSFFGKINQDINFKGFYQDGVGKGAKKLYAEILATVINSDCENIQELAKTNMMINKMIGHKAVFLKLTIKKAKIVLSNSEIYDLDDKLTPKFSKFAPNGKERFENSRHVLMTYLDREVFLSVFVENNIYYCLVKSDSNKMDYIKNGGICKVFDGKDVEFETVIDIIDDKKDEIFENLVKTNNAYFKVNQGLTALSFKGFK